MFSNRFLFGKIMVTLVLILSLCYYGLLEGPETELTFQKCMKNPEYYDGVELIISYHKVGMISPEHFELLVGNSTVIVMGKAGEAVEGDYVSVRTKFEKEGFLNLEEIHIHKGRRLKYALSLLPLPFVFWFFVSDYKLSKKGFERK